MCLINDKKIMIAVPFLSDGGAERVSALWANGLAELGEKVFLLTLYPVETEYELDERVKRINLANSRDKYKEMSFVTKIMKLRRVITDFEITVLIPLVTYVGILCHIAVIGKATKLIETIRNNPYRSPGGKMSFLRNLSVYTADGCIFQNIEQRKYFNYRLLRKHTIIKNPVTNDFVLCNRGYRKCAKKVVTFGRLHKQKNHLMLIEAMKKLEQKEIDLSLEIYGEGGERSRILAKIDELGLNEKVSVYPRTKQVQQKLLEADIFVLCSDYEGMPNSLMEAMATGIPCISTMCPTGPADLIRSGVDGVLVDVGDKEGLCEALIDMYNNYEAACIMGARAKEKMKQYSVNKIAFQVEQFIDVCCENMIQDKRSDNG